jgi:hypothetical protein
MREEKSKYVLRHNTEQTWQLYNPVLLSGEIGLSEYTHEDNTVQCLFKIGDGITPWNELPFAQPKTDTTLTLPYVAADAAAVGARLGYIDNELQTLKQTCVEIESFTIVPKYTEAGVSLGMITLSWVYGNYSTIASQTINGVTISPEIRSLTMTGEFTQSTTFNLVVTDGLGNTKTAQTKLEVLYPVFYGVREIPETYTEGFVYGLTKVIPTKEEFEFSTSSAESEYIYFCAPDSYGTCAFFHRGFEGGVQFVDSISLHLSETLTETYNIYRSDYPGLGNTRLRVTFSTGPHTDLTIEPTLPSGGTEGQILMKASNQDYDTYWVNLPKEIPNGGTTGQVLSKRSDATGDLEWKDFEGALPNVSTRDNGKILKVTNGYWGVGSESTELPNIFPEDTGKVLTAEEGVVSWKEIPSQLPATSAADEGDVLVVDGNGRWIKKPVIYEGAVVYEGAGAPTYQVICKKGDFYRDTTNNKLYFCWRYISPDPSTATELTGVTLTLRSTAYYPEEGLEDYSASYNYFGLINGLKIDRLWVENNVIKLQAYERNSFGQAVYSTYTICDGNVEDRSSIPITARTIAFNENASVVTDVPLVSWFIGNAASMSGTGSYWVEIVAKPDSGFPTVTTDDNGKVAIVRSGAWDKEYPEWTATYHGTGAPVGSIMATPGDFYRDDSSNELYQCTEYIDPYHITDLTGITFYFNPTVNNSNYNSGSSLQINFTIGSDYYTAMTVGYNSYSSRNTLSYFNNSTGWINLVYDSYLNRGWLDESYRTITITGGSEATNTDFINWIFSNAVAFGLGSQWVKLCPQESVLPEPQLADEGKVVSVSNAQYALTTPVTYENLEGAGAPTASTTASMGQIYIDISSGEAYYCTNYQDPTSITSLEDLQYTFDSDIIFPATIPSSYPETLFEYEADFTYSYETVDANDNSITVLRDGLKVKGVVDQITVQVETEEEGVYDSEDVTIYKLIYIYDDEGTPTEEVAYNTGNLYEQVETPLWTHERMREILFGNSGNDLENGFYIDFLNTNGNFYGYGSTWLRLSTFNRLPVVTIADNGKIPIVDNGEWTLVLLSSLLGGN